MIACPPESLEQLSEFVSAHMGLHFPPARMGDLRRGIASAAREFGFDDVAECIEWIVSKPPSTDQIEILASHLTVGETYFFRERASFQALEQIVLPELVEQRRGRQQSLRIWSAGCCTGEEAYSLAIAVARVIRDLSEWNITILATDINPKFLRRAAQGCYGEWSFRDVSDQLRGSYFSECGPGKYQILPHIREMVTFSYLNLAQDTFPALLTNTLGMDVIFCRNVMIYLGPEQTDRLARKLQRSLVDGGWLFLGAAEASHALASGLTMTALPDAAAYRKNPIVAPSATPPTRSIGAVVRARRIASSARRKHPADNPTGARPPAGGGGIRAL